MSYNIEYYLKGSREIKDNPLLSKIKHENIYQIKEKSIFKISGPLIFLKPSNQAIYNGLLLLEEKNGNCKHAQVIDASDQVVVAQVFEGTFDLQPEHTWVIQEKDIFKIRYSDALMGIPLSGLGIPLEKHIQIHPEVILPVTNTAINPYARDVPQSPIETGIPAIDCLNTLIKGQKLPIFTSSGLPGNELASSIAQHVGALANENLVVVFAGLGITKNEGEFFKEKLGETTSSSNILFFLNYVDDPTVETILTPRCALSVAEYLAFKKNKDVLVIMTDMLNYADALREIANAREEIPGRRGYPGYLYTDLATIFERTGRIKDYMGSITQLPIITLPNNDITHPVPDLTGYITEGQIVLSQNLHYKQINPPIDVLPSLSRLMQAGIGEGHTRYDHKYLYNQLYSSYAEGRKLKQIIAITGEESLTKTEKLYLRFADLFETHFIHCPRPMSMIETLDLGWRLICLFPKSLLIKIPEKILANFYKETKWSEFGYNEIID